MQNKLSRDVFRTLPNIYDGRFCENRKLLEDVSENASTQMFDRVMMRALLPAI